MSTDDERLILKARSRAIVDTLTPDDRERLQTLIGQATRDHRIMLDNALEEAARMVPAPFRRRLQKMFFG